MATVFLAQDLKHKRPVALKVLHPELANALGPERFHREVELVARLQHPHILTVLDSGEAAGSLWFTMPFVDGEPLRERLRRERQLPVDEAIRIATEAAKALDYAHRQGIIHRDIKPENILLTRDGDTLVADFGIARALSGGDERLTETGMAVGTPAYMSPEQASGERQLDGRTDVYALGAVLFEMLAGEPPFTGATAQAVIAKRFSGEVPRVRATRPTVPENVDQAISRALAPVAADRFPSAADLVKALAGGTSGATVSGPAAGRAIPSLAAPARRVPAGLALLVLGFLIGVGVLFAWKRGGHATAMPGARVIAVLPFENLGTPDEEYFADGVTDAVRGKLTGLPGLEVIASNSSTPYKNSTKSAQQIGQELGAQYLVVGKVRWEKGAEGASRVQVSPELIQVSTGTARWQQPFDAALTDVFQVQADIAGSVAGALNVALGTGERQALAERPTRNVAAYDAFLRGEEVSERLSTRLQEGAALYEQAVALDSTFVQAWSRLSRAHSLLAFNGSTNPTDGTSALRAAQRAIALAPGSPDALLAMGDYWNYVQTDFAKAVGYYSEGLRIAPGNAELIASAGIAEQSLGRADTAMVWFRRSLAIDPRSLITIRRLGRAQLWMRRYDEGRETTERGLAVAPGSVALLQNLVMIQLAQGDLPGARDIVANPAGVEPTQLAVFFATFWDLYWVLSPEQQALLLRLPPRMFDDNRATWALALAETYALQGNQAQAHAYADSARQTFEKALKVLPNDNQSQSLLGVALAYLGRKAEAIRAAERGVALLPISKDAYSGPYNQLQLVRVYILTGEHDKAVTALEPLLQIPFYITPGWLRVDPTFAPLKGNPRFERLIAP
jgi:serine/threonine-protein kinase